MNNLYLHRDDLQTILQIMDAFDHHTVEIEHNDLVVKINLHGVDFNGLKVTVSKEIINEQDE